MPKPRTLLFSVPEFSRAQRLATIASLMASLYACGGGGGGADSSTGAPPGVQSYSSLYFSKADSAVAIVESGANGSGFVGYRNAAGLVRHVDYLAKDKTAYHFKWGSDVSNPMFLEFDGMKIMLWGFDAGGQPGYFTVFGTDGKVIIQESMPAQKALLKSDIVERDCVANQRVQDEGEATREIYGSMVDFRCAYAAKVMATVTPIATIFGYVLDQIERRVVQASDATVGLLKKGEKLLTSRELQESVSRFAYTPRGETGFTTQVITKPGTSTGGELIELTPEERAALIGDVRKTPNATAAGGVLDWTLVKPVGTGATPTPSPAPSPAPAPTPSPTPAPSPAPTPTPAPAPSPTPAPAPASSFSGTYNISGSGVTVTFPVDGNGNIGQCSAGTLITCSGKVNTNGSFNLSGNDGAGTSAVLSGNIDASGKVTGSYSGTSDGVPIQGSFSGSRTGGGGSGATGSFTSGGLTWSWPLQKMRFTEAVAYCSAMGARLPTATEAYKVQRDSNPLAAKQGVIWVSDQDSSFANDEGYQGVGWDIGTGSSFALPILCRGTSTVEGCFKQNTTCVK